MWESEAAMDSTAWRITGPAGVVAINSPARNAIRAWPRWCPAQRTVASVATTNNNARETTTSKVIALSGMEAAHRADAW